jgi:hypothetical protein
MKNLGDQYVYLATTLIYFSDNSARKSREGLMQIVSLMRARIRVPEVVSELSITNPAFTFQLPSVSKTK